MVFAFLFPSGECGCELHCLAFYFFNLIIYIFKEATQGLKVQPVGIKAVFVIILNSSLCLPT